MRFVALIVLALTSVARADFILINDLVDQGQATVTASPWDIGDPRAIFDRDFDNLYRSASINPAIITIQFVHPQTVGAMRSLVIASPHEITLDAADTVADLDSQTGTFVRVLDHYVSPENEIGWAEWNDNPVTRRVWRFSVHRLQRDDFVHIRELELQTPEPVEEIDVDGHTVRVNVMEMTPGFTEIPVGQTQPYAVEASLSYGPDRYHVTDIADWSSSDEGVATVAAGLATGVGVGETEIAADIGVIHAAQPLSVRGVRPIDLDVGYIKRTPEYERFHVDFSGDQHIAAGYEDQQKWPAPGEIVTWTANIFNKGDVEAHDVDYVWRFDGVEVDAGTIAELGPGERVLLTYARPWPADVVQTLDIDPGAEVYQPAKYERAVGNHTIACELDPAGVVDDANRLNNQVRQYINAIQYHFYMEQHTYDEFSRKASFLETYSPEDWAQGVVLAQQRKMWVSGVRQRFRLSELEVVPDGTLDPGGTHEPIGNVTWTTDGVWGFDWPSDYLEIFRKRVDQALLHELGHQVGLIDIYNYDISIENMQIRHNGVLVADTPLMPRVSPWNVYYGNERYWYDNGVAHVDSSRRGAMAGPGARFFGPGSAAGMNRDIGLRRGFFGDYLGAVPQGAIGIHLHNQDGSPVAGASLRVFQRERSGIVPNNPKFSGTTDADGRWIFPHVTLPGWQGGISVNNPWSSIDGGFVFNGPDPVGRNAVLVVEATWNDGGEDVSEYYFVEVDDLNIAFGAGATEDYDIDIVTHRSRAGDHLPVVTFTSGSEVWINEGDTFVTRAFLDDADGDPVTLSVTPLANSTFTPATHRFEFRPDSLQVTDFAGAVEPLTVLFIADDGKFRTVQPLTIHVADVDGLAVLHPVVPDAPLACAADFNHDGAVDFFDVQAFLNAYAAGEPGADMNGDGAYDFFDVQTYLNAYSAGCP